MDYYNEFYRRKFTFLLVDDAEVNNFLVFSIIRNLFPDSVIITGKNGKDAIALYEEFSPDMIFMDIQMPILNGFEATRKIREIDTGRYKKTVIIAISNHNIGSSQRELEELGMDNMIHKPVETHDIVKICTKYLEKKTSIEYFNPQALLDCLYGDRNAFKETINLALHSDQSLKNEFGRIREAFTDHDRQRMKKRTHRLKGICSALFLNEFSQKIAALERLLDQPVIVIQAYIDQLETDLEKVIMILSGYLDNPGMVIEKDDQMVKKK